MDYTKKPEIKNPRKGAYALSQLFFTWVIPIMSRVSGYTRNLAILQKITTPKILLINF